MKATDGPLERLFTTWGDYDTSITECVEQAPDIFRSTRKRLGLTQKQLAVRLNVNHTYISKIEKRRLNAGRPILLKLAEIIRENVK